MNKIYAQVIESLPVLELPHPNPPLYKGRERKSIVSVIISCGSVIATAL
ncbi:hypothetical protein [Nostoc sp. ChiVER01]|nr:hypothetical protein [Nostoc sp. ChiVER01]MDZ8221390.1 hypothetical protein [Nostoc sp. ChiVER01]